MFEIDSLGTSGEVGLSRGTEKVEESPQLSTPGIFDKADLVSGTDNHIQFGESNMHFEHYKTGSFFPTRRSILVPVSLDCTTR